MLPQVLPVLPVSVEPRAPTDLSGMDAPDLVVLRAAEAWLQEGMSVWTATVLETYGSAPRPVGSMAAINARGEVAGSVSGGCVEDDLVDMLVRDARASREARSVLYGVSDDERARLRLPCNGQLMVWIEPAELSAIAAQLSHVAAGRLVHRTLDLRSGCWTTLSSGASRSQRVGEHFEHVLGPTYRLVLIGASEVSRYLAPMGMALGFQVEVIDPRHEYLSIWPHAGCTLHDNMPDDVLQASPPDARTAVVALSHDPKIDDLALIEALRQPAFYVGAMGSIRTTTVRRERLRKFFDLTSAQLERLRGPVGVDIGARTPPEIAIAVAADLVQTIRQVA